MKTILEDLSLDFLVIGSQKAGTTLLWELLRQHPRIYMPTTKEPHYLCIEDIKNFKGPHGFFWDNRTDNHIEYINLFKNAPKEMKKGEASSHYMYSQTALKNINNYFKGIKLLVILRNPADRAFSNYCFYRRMGLETMKSFEDALALEDSRKAEGWGIIWYYKEKGCYHKYLKKYFDTFDNNLIHVIIYEELILKPEIIFTELCHFLEITPMKMPSSLPILNRN